jgi:hypothetical protein
MDMVINIKAEYYSQIKTKLLVQKNVCVIPLYTNDGNI